MIILVVWGNDSDADNDEFPDTPRDAATAHAPAVYDDASTTYIVR
jgi:hypothetical protein